ncbi:hypothetical protein [Streptomyces fulvoviolaceus]|nr:hypothetical protein [Streptomyces fulvoviolaceus]
MTTVRTTTPAPPPRLPVRDKAAALDRGWGGVSPMLTRLAAERATGILVRERGTLHLADGQVVHAESPSAPGLDTLLTPHGGDPAPGALELCHLTALYDAAYFTLAPSSTPGRFRYGSAVGLDGPLALGAVRPVPVAALERETLRRRDLLHRIWPDPTTDEAPLTRPDRVGAPPCPARRRAVLARVDGVRTALDIARELGRPAFHTLVDVRRLAAAGVVSPRPPTPAEAPPPPPQPLLETEVVDPHITLLKRLRDALEAL